MNKFIEVTLHGKSNTIISININHIIFFQSDGCTGSYISIVGDTIHIKEEYSQIKTKIENN